MFAKKTRIISLLLAAVLLLCPLQAASAETQTVSEKIKANLIEQIEQNPDEKFGVYVILDLDNDEIKRQAREIWEKDTDPNKDDFNHFAAVYERNFCIEYEDDFIKLKIGKQMVKFTGQNLQIKCMTGENVIIDGRILSVNLWNNRRKSCLSFVFCVLSAVMSVFRLLAYLLNDF